MKKVILGSLLSLVPQVFGLHIEYAYTAAVETVCAQKLLASQYASVPMAELAESLGGEVLYENILNEVVRLHGIHRPDKTGDPSKRFGFTLSVSGNAHEIEPNQGNDSFGIFEMDRKLIETLRPVRLFAKWVMDTIQNSYPGAKETQPHAFLFLTTDQTQSVMDKLHTHEECLLVANIQLVPGAEGVEILGVPEPESFGHLTVFGGQTKHRIPKKIDKRLALVIFFNQPE